MNNVQTFDDILGHLSATEYMGYRSMAKTRQAGTAWAKLVQDSGCSYKVSDTCVHVLIRFTPGDKDAYQAATRLTNRLRSACPQVGSFSMWGNDGVGTMIAEETGCIDIACGSVSVRFLAGLR
jgi:hypothetical protein